METRRITLEDMYDCGIQKDFTESSLIEYRTIFSMGYGFINDKTKKWAYININYDIDGVTFPVKVSNIWKGWLCVGDIVKHYKTFDSAMKAAENFVNGN